MLVLKVFLGLVLAFSSLLAVSSSTRPYSRWPEERFESFKRKHDLRVAKEEKQHQEDEDPVTNRLEAGLSDDASVGDQLELWCTVSNPSASMDSCQWHSPGTYW